MGIYTDVLRPNCTGLEPPWFPAFLKRLRTALQAKNFAFGFDPVFERITMPVPALDMQLVGAVGDSCLQIIARGYWLAMDWFFGNR